MFHKCLLTDVKSFRKLPMAPEACRAFKSKWPHVRLRASNRTASSSSDTCSAKRTCTRSWRSFDAAIMLATVFTLPKEEECSSSVDTEPSYFRATLSAAAKVTAADFATGLASSARLDRPRRSFATALDIATLSWRIEPDKVRRLSKMYLKRGQSTWSSTVFAGSAEPLPGFSPGLPVVPACCGASPGRNVPASEGFPGALRPWSRGEPGGVLGR